MYRSECKNEKQVMKIRQAGLNQYRQKTRTGANQTEWGKQKSGRKNKVNAD